MESTKTVDLFLTDCALITPKLTYGVQRDGEFKDKVPDELELSCLLSCFRHPALTPRYVGRLHWMPRD